MAVLEASVAAARDARKATSGGEAPAVAAASVAAGTSAGEPIPVSRGKAKSKPKAAVEAEPAETKAATPQRRRKSA
jgi:hypothetical protein